MRKVCLESMVIGMEPDFWKFSAIRWVCLFYVAARKKVPTCDSVHSWPLYSSDSLGYQATGPMAYLYLIYLSQNNAEIQKPLDHATLIWLCSTSRTNPTFSLFVVYFLAKSKIISGRVWTCDSAHSWWLYSAVPLVDQAIITMTWYPTQSYYPDTEPTSHCPILIMLSAWLGSSKYRF